ncbi:SORT protein, partial [Columbina picui]|nr:SORT protein [Columbina picui]
QCVFDDLSGSVSLSWVGDSTGVILVLTTFQVPLVIMSFGQSKLYRSEDYGKTFMDITGLLNNTFIRTEFGMAIGPENSGKVILTGDVSGGSRGGRIFRSSDFAKNFVQTDLPFHPLVQITYHPRNADCLLALSTEVELGAGWEPPRAGRGSPCVPKDQLDRGCVSWVPSLCLGMHTGFGTIYTSDDRGIVYSKSLERHLYTTTGGETDFTNVTSLRGIYITSVLSEDNSIQSVITFDRGGEWVPLRKPKNTTCDSTARSKDECSLHIHASYSISQKLNVPMAPLSEPNAVGIVIAHGSVGGAISVMSPDVYISDDGGYTWARMLEGPHHYAILDSGGLIVAIEHSSQPVNVIEYVWGPLAAHGGMAGFGGDPKERGERSWGRSWSTRWVSYTIDFSQLLSRTCEDKDYTIWLAHSSDPSDPSDGCILGYKEQYRRLRKSSVCQNGREYTVTKQPSVCPCTLEDFLCDFGYYRPENQSVCVEQPELKGHDLEFCLYGRRELLKTSGYRKIPGDKCSGGESPSREETDMKKKCTSNFLNPSQLAASPSSTPIILAVVTVLLVTVVAGVLIVKKYVCGGRFLVHRYSVLRQHAEASGGDGLDTLDPGPTATKGGYHDDSDEVSAG